jgi:hypothetical protein
MRQPKTSIKWPSKASIERRIKGLREIESRVVTSRPEPWWGEGKWVKGLQGWFLQWEDGKTPKWDTPEGQKWSEMRAAIQQLIREAEDLLTMIPKRARVAKQSTNQVEAANGN